MRFGDAQYLWLLLAIPLVALAGWYVHARKLSALKAFAGGPAFVARFTAEVSVNRRAVKLLLMYLALSMVILALARPQWGTRLEPITRRGADVVIVLDTSLSMATEDLAPDRLGQARHAIGTLLDEIPGDRVALVTFAGQASVNCPLTVDHAALEMFLESLDVESIPLPGTAVAGALRAAFEALKVKEGEADDRGRAIVLFSDGEDHEGGLDPLLDELESNGISVHSVGCGTTRGGPIPIRDGSGTITGYKKDREGKVVTTRLNEGILEQVALATGGRYYRATSSELEIEELAQTLASLSQGELGSEVRTRYEERFYVPLLVGFAALLLETLIGDRRRVRAEARGPERRAA